MELLNSMQARRAGGELIGIGRVRPRSSPLATGCNDRLGRVCAEFSLEVQYRELIMLRVAALNRADFEWGMHYPEYLPAGGTEEKCHALTAESVDGLFDGKERALITLTDQSTKQVNVGAEVIENLNSLFGESQTVEAVATAAVYNMVSCLLVALAI